MGQLRAVHDFLAKRITEETVIAHRVGPNLYEDWPAVWFQGEGGDNDEFETLILAGQKKGEPDFDAGTRERARFVVLNDPAHVADLLGYLRWTVANHEPVDQPAERGGETIAVEVCPIDGAGGRRGHRPPAAGPRPRSRHRPRRRPGHRLTVGRRGPRLRPPGARRHRARRTPPGDPPWLSTGRRTSTTRSRPRPHARTADGKRGDLERIEAYYTLRSRIGVRVAIGLRVRHGGQEGTIVGTAGQYLLVLHDGDTEPRTCHPTANMEYATDSNAWVRATPRPDPYASAPAAVEPAMEPISDGTMPCPVPAPETGHPCVKPIPKGWTAAEGHGGGHFWQSPRVAELEACGAHYDPGSLLSGQATPWHEPKDCTPACWKWSDR